MTFWDPSCPRILRLQAHGDNLVRMHAFPTSEDEFASANVITAICKLNRRLALFDSNLKRLESGVNTLLPSAEQSMKALQTRYLDMFNELCQGTKYVRLAFPVTVTDTPAGSQQSPPQKATSS